MKNKYFKLRNVLNRLFTIAEIIRITFKEVFFDIDKYHQDVKHLKF
jgi:Zn-dependent oligopeptidase